jgi:hypothetical protein
MPNSLRCQGHAKYLSREKRGKREAKPEKKPTKAIVIHKMYNQFAYNQPSIESVVHGE